MALSKPITAPNGVTYNYIRATAQRWDPDRKEFSCFFIMYASEAARNSAPEWGMALGKLRVSGADFDTYLSPSLYCIEQVYEAAKVLPLDVGAPFSPSILHNAETVQE